MREGVVHPLLNTNATMYSPAYSLRMKTVRRLAPCSSSVVLPLMPTWFDRAAAFAVTGAAVLAIAGAAVTSV